MGEVSELKTLADLPFWTAGRFPRPVLMGRAFEGRVDEIPAREVLERVRDLSLGLTELGVRPGDRVAIIAESRPEWTLADLAILTARAVTVPIYPTLPPSQVRYILADSGARFVFAANPIQLAKIHEVWHQLPQLEGAAIIDPGAAEGGGERDERLGTFAELAARGHGRLVKERGIAREFRERSAGVTPDDLATIIYTSGTTGEPKGVMLTHGNLVSNLLASQHVLPLSEEDVALSFLPLSHVFERLVVYLYLYKGVTVVFAESLETVARDITRVRPTLMTGVPRVYEKLYSRIHEKAEQAPPPRRAIFRLAVSVGLARSRAKLEGRRPPLLSRLLHPLLDRLVFSKIREAVGGRVRFLVSGAAPLRRDIGEFFHAAGLLIIEGYGLTETSPVLTVNPIDAPRFGTVGTTIPGVELRIEEDGEILARGPNIMRGYYHKPDATAEALRDGWFHTGDVGHIDADGYLAITDRKKDLIVTSGGKNIAPQPVEATLKASPLVAEAVLIGDRRKFVSTLIVPNVDALRARIDLPAEVDRAALVRRPDVRAVYQAVVDDVNRELPQYETIKQFALLGEEFTIAGGELTPTMKVRRNVIEARYRDVIEAIYQEPAPARSAS